MIGGLVSSAPTVAEAMARPANGFAVTRLALALAVVVSHAFSVSTGRVGDEPLHEATGFSLGEHAVNGFFAISGFLVTMSYERRGWRDYALARALRIVPGLVVSALVVSLVLGAALTRLDLASYLSDPALWRYIFNLLTAFKTNAALPGVFPDNPLRAPMGTVWTLKWEIICYAGVLAAGLAGLLRGRAAATAFAAACLVGLAGLGWLFPDAGKEKETMLRLPFLFAAGAVLYLWRGRARLSGPALALLALATILSSGTPLYRPLLFAAEAYGILWVALSPVLARPVFDLEEDLSYGTYLYGWPIQQALTQIWPAASPLALLAASVVLTLPVAAASWFGVEKPALSLKARALRGRTLKAAGPAAP